MNIYKSTIPMGNGNQKTVLAIYHNDEVDAQAVVQSTVVERLHHVLVIDRSGSVSSHINNLIDHAQMVFDDMGENDLVTFIWYSGVGQFRTIIKGATKSDDVKAKLDTLRSVVGCTCFSESFVEINTILDEIGDLAPVSITLWTDGQPVVPHGTVEEERRCFAELAKMKDRILAFNVIGYGNYYNESLMKAFAATSEFGEAFHSSKIEDYRTIFNHNFAKLADVTAESIKVEANANIIYLNRTFTKMANEEFHLSRIDKRKNQFFLVGDGDFEFIYNGVTLDSATCPIKAQMNPAQIANFYYALAYNSYYAGDRKTALAALSQLHDKALIDSHMSAFTYDESGEHLKRLNTALFYPAVGRFIDGIADDNYVPAPDALCVMDVLNQLQLGTSFYVPFGKNVTKYSRIGKKVTDEFNLFTWSDEEVRVPFTDFVANKNQMNLSIRLRIKGSVKINPKDAKEVGLESSFPSFIYRNHTVIKDGNLNIPRIEVLLSEEDFANMTIFEAIEDGAAVLGHEDIEVDGEVKHYIRAVLNLAQLPVINRTYINEVLTIKDIFHHAVAINTLEALQKVVGFQLERFPLTEKKAVGHFAALTEPQIALLLRNGVNPDGSYGGVENVAPSKDECDSYQVRTMEFVIAGFSSWPKMTDVFERKADIDAGKAKAKFTVPMAKLYEQHEVLRQLMATDGLLLEASDNSEGDKKLMASLLDLQKKIRKDLQKLRGELHLLKIAKLLSGDWFDDLISDGKGGYFYEQDGVKMVAKTAYTTKYVTPSSTEE